MGMKRYLYVIDNVNAKDSVVEGVLKVYDRGEGRIPLVVGRVEFTSKDGEFMGFYQKWHLKESEVLYKVDNNMKGEI